MGLELNWTNSGLTRLLSRQGAAALQTRGGCSPDKGLKPLAPTVSRCTIAQWRNGVSGNSLPLAPSLLWRLRQSAKILTKRKCAGVQVQYPTPIARLGPLRNAATCRQPATVWHCARSPRLIVKDCCDRPVLLRVIRPQTSIQPVKPVDRVGDRPHAAHSQ